MKGLRQLLKQLDIDDSKSKKIIEFVVPDNLDNYVEANFKPSEALIKSRWIPSKVIYDFIAIKRPDDHLTANLIGRALTKINVVSRNNHVKGIGSMPGYYVEAINNLLHYELSKFYRDYDYGHND